MVVADDLSLQRPHLPSTYNLNSLAKVKQKETDTPKDWGFFFVSRLIKSNKECLILGGFNPSAEIRRSYRARNAMEILCESYHRRYDLNKATTRGKIIQEIEDYASKAEPKTKNELPSLSSLSRASNRISQQALPLVEKYFRSSPKLFRIYNREPDLLMPYDVSEIPEEIAGTYELLKMSHTEEGRVSRSLVTITKKAHQEVRSGKTVITPGGFTWRYCLEKNVNSGEDASLTISGIIQVNHEQLLFLGAEQYSSSLVEKKMGMHIMSFKYRKKPNLITGIVLTATDVEHETCATTVILKRNDKFTIEQTTIVDFVEKEHGMLVPTIDPSWKMVVPK